MTAILSHTLTLERIERLFTADKLTAQIVEVEPAIPEQDLPRLAYLKVDHAETPPVLVWIDTQIPFLLRFRVIIRTRTLTRDPDDPPVQSWMIERRAQQDWFGLDASGTVRQMTLDDRLPYQDAIISGVIVATARGMSRIAEDTMMIAQVFG